jgi:hypothetical protein
VENIKKSFRCPSQSNLFMSVLNSSWSLFTGFNHHTSFLHYCVGSVLGSKNGPCVKPPQSRFYCHLREPPSLRVRLSTVTLLGQTTSFKSSALYIENITCLFYKTRYYNVEVTRTEPSLAVNVHSGLYYKVLQLLITLQFGVKLTLIVRARPYKRKFYC